MDEFTEQIDSLIAATRDGLVDSFATFSGQINDRNYADAAVTAHALAYGLALFSQGLATEALARKIENMPLDKPDE